MKLMRVGPVGAECPAVLLDDNRVVDASSVAQDFGPSFFASDGLSAVSSAVAAGALPEMAAEGLRVGSPIGRPGKIICVGRNYRDHIAESGAAVPTEPVIVMKAASAMVGPHDDVAIPRGSQRTDWEVELAVVIGKTARYLDSPADARAVVAAYALANDVSERDFQSLRTGGQWDRGKSCETFFPLGPWLVTPDEVHDPQALDLRTWVNGELRQDSNTKHMVFGVDHLIWYISRYMVLEPGDVISTGTPAGCAMGFPDEPFLRDGDVMEFEVTGLGRARQRCYQAGARRPRVMPVAGRAGRGYAAAKACHASGLV
jgi:2-keto-4-pentenoate hydratase/2-oxohepta-3-ene-1,7-dioic acid hydratase in catechol pathway